MSMGVDTGAAATISNEETYKRIIEGNLVKNRKLLETAKVKLRTYTGDLVKVIGTLNVIVKYTRNKKWNCKYSWWKDLGLTYWEGTG